MYKISYTTCIAVMGVALTCAMLSPAQAQGMMGGAMAAGASTKLLNKTLKDLQRRRVEDRMRRPHEPVMTGRPVGPSRVVRPLPSTGVIQDHRVGRPDTRPTYSRPRPGPANSMIDHAARRANPVNAIDRLNKRLSQSPALGHAMKRTNQARDLTVATRWTALRAGGAAARAGGSALRAGARAAGNVGKVARKLLPL
jgi:hypothetical protein